MTDLVLGQVLAETVAGVSAEAVTRKGAVGAVVDAGMMDSSQPREVEVQRMAEEAEVLENR